MLFCAARADLRRPGHPTGARVRARRRRRPLRRLQRRLPGLRPRARRRPRDQPRDTATDGLWPDLTLLIRVDPEAALARADGEDRFESEGVEFQRAVAEAYEEIAQIAADRFVAIDGSGSVEEVHRRVMEAVRAAWAQAHADAQSAKPEAGETVSDKGGRGREREGAPGFGSPRRPSIRRVPGSPSRLRSPPAPLTPTSSAGRGVGARPRPPAPSPPRSSPAGPPIRTVPGAARCSAPHRIQTSSGSPRAGPSTWSPTFASG